MQRIHSIFALCAAAFLLLGNVGFDIFSHVCAKDGVAVSYFVQDDSMCASHEHEDAHLHEDEAMEECGDHAEGSCCTTTAKHVQIKVDFASKVLVKPILIAHSPISFVWNFETPAVEEVIFSFSGTDPPPKSGKSICIDIQEWLI